MSPLTPASIYLESRKRVKESAIINKSVFVSAYAKWMCICATKLEREAGYIYSNDLQDIDNMTGV